MKVCGNIGVVARERMVNIIRQAAHEISGNERVGIVFFEQMFEDSFEQINKSVDNIDIFLAGHGHSQLLHKWFPNKPFITVKPLPFDIMFAIREAAKIDETVNIINTYELIELNNIKEIFRNDFKISQYTFKNDDELKKIFSDIRENGGKTVVGGTLVNDLAPRFGLESFYYYSSTAVKYAIQDAANLVFLKYEQKVYQENINKIIDLSNLGLMVVTHQQKVHYINNIALKMLGRSNANTLGIDVKEILIDWDNTKLSEEGKLITINGHQVLCDLITFDYNNDDYDNYILRFQEVDQVEKASYKIRRHMLSKPAAAKYYFNNIIGKGLYQTKEIARSYAIASDANILIVGPTGCGKELFASSIHNHSSRANEPFIPVNCAALPENLLESELFGYEAGAFTGARQHGKKGLIELAHKGTLFFDEIGEMPITLQAKLLRVIQEKEVLHVGGELLIPVDVRVISATNSDMVESINNRTFRPDLYYRLSTLVLEIPPLLKRRSDIPELIDYYFKYQTMPIPCKKVVNDVICQFYHDYDWPGNVRELQNVLERIVTYVRYTSKENIPNNDLKQDLLLFLQKASVDKGEISRKLRNQTTKLGNIKISEAVIHHILNSVGGNKTKVAELLGVSRSTLWRYLKC